MVKKLLSITILGIPFLPTAVYALTAINNPLTGGSQALTSPQLYARFAALIFTLSGVMAVIVIMYGVVLMLTSRGEEDKVEKGKMMIVWTVVGMIVIGSAYAIAAFIIQTANKAVLVNPR
ncbi:hypothetical protein HZA86_02580 [Candidatus Uhrbacteria bacterium]|nr:hypothetical protein [Candidatus Uhrbacteria bacterium]